MANSAFSGKLDKILANMADKAAGFDGRVAQAGVLGAYYLNGVSVAYVAAIQEFGDPSHNIPPRSFMRTTVAEQKDAWLKALRAGAKATVHGKISPDDALNQVGALMAADIKVKITDITTPPLKPATIAARARRSASGEVTETLAKPLVDTGLLLASISHDVGDDE